MDVDPTLVALQLIPFLLAFVGLHYIIFKPMLAMLAEREKNIFGFKKEAELLEEEVAGKLAEIEGRLGDARGAAAAERARLRTDAQAAERAIVEEARRQADAMATRSRALIEAERVVARVQLRETARQLSVQIASTVLGRTVGEA